MKRQVTQLGIARVVGALVQTITLVGLARLAGARDFGTVGTGVAAYGVLSTVAGLGLAPYMAREYALRNYAAVRGGAQLNLVATGTSALLGFVIAPLIGDSTAMIGAMALLSSGIALERMTETLLAVSIASERIKDVTVSIALRNVTLLAAFGALALTGSDPVIAYCVGRVASGTIGQIHVRFVSPYRSGSTTAAMATTLRDVQHLAYANTASAVRGLDVPTVSIASAPAEVGYYSAAVRVAAPLSLISSTIGSVIMPVAAARPPAYTRALHRRVMTLWLCATVAAVVGAGPVVDPFVSLIFGPDFALAGGAVYWVIVGTPSLLASPLLATLLQARRDDRYVARSSIAFTVVLLPAIWIGAHLGGAAAASAVTTTLTGLRVAELSLRLHRRQSD